MKLLTNSTLPLDHPYLINKYTQWYYDIIKSSKLRISKNSYNELHHIIPDCFYIKNRSNGKRIGWINGDSNSKDNIVKLTIKEHFICHWLLTKMVKYKTHPWYQMQRALSGFKRSSDGQKRIYTSGQYEIIRLANILSKIGRVSPLKGRISPVKGKRSPLKGRSSPLKGRVGHSKGKPSKLKGRTTITPWLQGTKWFNNGVDSVRKVENPGLGWVEGRLPFANVFSIPNLERNKKISIALTGRKRSTTEMAKRIELDGNKPNLGKRWWTDGKNSMLSTTQPGDDWILGRTVVKLITDQ